MRYSGVGIAAITAALAVAPAALLADTLGDMRAAMMIVGLGAAAVGVRFFWVHGHRQITAAGIFAYAVIAFCAFPAFYFVQNRALIEPPLLVAVIVTYVTSLAILLPQHTTSALFPSPKGVKRSLTPTSVRKFFFAGVPLAAIGALASTLEVTAGIDSFIEGVGFVGALLMGVGFLQPRVRRLTVPRVVAALLAFATYVVFIFDGFGRLELVGLGLAMLVFVGCFAVPGRTVKAGMLALLVPGMIVLGAWRAGAGTSLDFEAENDGLESVISPLEMFAQLTADEPEYAFGHTFFATSVIYVPRALWEDKPVGFGRELARKYATPLAFELTPISYAALSQGEWYWNFGWAGLLSMMPALAWFVWWIDRRLAAALANNSGSIQDGLVALLYTLLAVGLVDLFWTGTFAYAQRSLGRVAAVLVLLLVINATARRQSPVPSASIRSARVGARPLESTRTT